jgi:hypothetical protein
MAQENAIFPEAIIMKRVIKKLKEAAKDITPSKWSAKKKRK